MDCESAGLEELDQRIENQADRLRTTIDALNTAHSAFTAEAAELYRLRQQRTRLLAEHQTV